MIQKETPDPSPRTRELRVPTRHEPKKPELGGTFCILEKVGRACNGYGYMFLHGSWSQEQPEEAAFAIGAGATGQQRLLRDLSFRSSFGLGSSSFFLHTQKQEHGETCSRCREREPAPAAQSFKHCKGASAITKSRTG